MPNIKQNISQNTNNCRNRRHIYSNLIKLDFCFLRCLFPSSVTFLRPYDDLGYFNFRSNTLTMLICHT